MIAEVGCGGQAGLASWDGPHWARDPCLIHILVSLCCQCANHLSFFTSAPPICSRCNLLYTSGLTVKGINNLLFIGLAMTEDMKIPTLDPKELLQASWLLLIVTKDVGPCSCPFAMFIA